ncbi:MAG: DNA adenine methylase [Thermodesulfobacteriota bacterium]
MAKTIIENLPPHSTYCEVFAGAAWVLFKKEPSKYEVLNDINSDLVTFYRVVKHHLEEFVRQLKWCLLSREWWDDWTRQLAAGGLTDIQRAARYYYIQRLGFGGKVAGRTFGAGPGNPPRINLLRMEEELSACHLRLARATIEHLPYQAFLERYDRPDTCFYLDPPYWGCEDFYGKGIFGREDFTRLATLLGGIKGAFVLSLNDTPGVREVFAGFTITPVSTRYSCARMTNSSVNEVLITKA